MVGPGQGLLQPTRVLALQPAGSELQIPGLTASAGCHSDGRESSRGEPHPGVPTETLSGTGIPASRWQNLGLDLDTVAAGARLTQTSGEQMWWGGWARPGWRQVGAPAALGSWGQNSGGGGRGSDGPRSAHPGAGPKAVPGRRMWRFRVGAATRLSTQPRLQSWEGRCLEPGEAAARPGVCVGAERGGPAARGLSPGQGSLSWAQSLWARGFHPCSRTDEAWLWTISAATAKRPDTLTVVPPAVHQDPSFRAGLGGLVAPRPGPGHPPGLASHGKAGQTTLNWVLWEALGGFRRERLLVPV